MKHLILLLKIQFLGLFNLNRHLQTDKRKAASSVALVAVVAAVIGAAVCAYMAFIAQSLAAMGAARSIPLLGAVLVSVAVVVTTFMKANGTLFALSDYDEIMSLPVKVPVVVLSRLIPLYALNVLFSALVLIPMMAVYGQACPFPPSAVACTAVAVVLIPAIPSATAVILAAVAAFASARMRHANAVMSCVLMVLLVALVIGVMGVTSSPGTEADLAAMDASTMDALGAAYPPALWAAAGMAGEAIGPFALFAGLSAVVGAFMVAALARLFQPVNQRLASARVRAEDAAMQDVRTLRVCSPFAALLAKEARMLLNTPIYFMNACAGFALALVASVAVAAASALGHDLLSAVPAELRGTVALFIPWVLAFMVGMMTTTPASVSLEGRCRWLMLTAPVPVRTTLGAKLALGLATGVPVAVVSGILLAWGLGIDGLQAAALVLCGVAAVAFSASLGLMMDVRYPRFDWTSPYEPVKRGASVFTSVLGAVAYVVLGCAATASAGVWGTVAMAAAGLVLSVLFWRDAVNVEGA